MLDLAQPAVAGEFDSAEWSAAEVFDTTLTDHQTLRALVLRLGARQWQWSVSSLDGDRGELISSGVEKTAAAARETAAGEIAKCLDDPLA